MDYVPYAVPFFLLAILIELSYGWLKNNDNPRNYGLAESNHANKRNPNKYQIFIFEGE